MTELLKTYPQLVYAIVVLVTILIAIVFYFYFSRQKYFHINKFDFNKLLIFSNLRKSNII